MWWMSSGGECGARKSGSGSWSEILSESLGANANATATVTVTVTLILTSILTSTLTLIATRSLSAKPPLIWSVSGSVISRVGCRGDFGLLCCHCCLDPRSAILIWAWHDGSRGCGVCCVANLAIGRGRVLFLFLFLVLGLVLLGSCARHCRRFACAAWMAGPSAFPPAQDPTWRSVISVCVSPEESKSGANGFVGRWWKLKQEDGLRQNGIPARSSKQQADPQAGVKFGGRQKRDPGCRAGWANINRAGVAAGIWQQGAGISSAAKARGSLVTS